MRKCRPSKWVPWAVAGVGLPLLAAAMISTGGMKSEVAGAAQGLLSGSDLTKWATVDMTGRVATVTGKTTNPAAIEEVVKLVAGTYGVRQVVNQAVAEPLALVAPTVAAITGDAPITEITGSWPEGVAKTLSVKVGETAYTLPGSPELTTSSGNWLLKFPQPLPAGNYDISATASVDSDGATVAQSTPAPVQVVVAPVVVPEPAPEPAPVPAVEPEPASEPAAAADTVPPAAPAIAAISADATESRTISGTWAEGDASSLTATLDGRSYVLGRGVALTRTEDKPGTFTFSPNTVRLAPGKYSVEFATADAAGNVAKAMAENAIIIPEPPKPAEPAPQPEPAAQAEPEPAPQPAPEPAPAPAAEPVKLAAPTVDKLLDLTGAPIIRGTWPAGEGTSLTIDLGGKTYELGQSANLAEDGPGKWKLLPSAALQDGMYDVVVTAKNGDVEVKDANTDEIEVDATVPATPTVAAYASDVAPTALAGTYDSKRTTSLKVAVPELQLATELGATGSPLTADGDNWTLALPAPVAPGTYNVVVTSTDKRGRTVEDAAAGEIVISAHNEAAPKSDAQYDCSAIMARISTVFPMRFVYNKIDFQERFGLSVSQYAALLKDSRCTSLKLEVGGHADERGDDTYNEDLAERRAARVRDMLVEAGVDTARLTVASYGESMPLDTTATEEGWAKNRRVELKILK